MSSTLAPLSNSKLTGKYQTTVPGPVRNLLGLQKGDWIYYSVLPDNSVVISKKEPIEDDPAIGSFLKFIETDMTNNPQHIQVIRPELVENIQALVAGVEIDLDSPLSDEDE